MSFIPKFNPWTRTLQWVQDMVGVVDWADITDKPTSTVSAIDDAVSDSHTHSNKTTLDGTEEEFTTTLKDKLDSIVNPMLFKGIITVAADFPTLATVENGWTYNIAADVTDNDATKTNTGLAFLQDAEIAWNGSTWVSLGYAGVKSVNGQTGIVSLNYDDVGAEPVGAAVDAIADHNSEYDHLDIALNTDDRHVQGTDQVLDEGGANEISAANAKAAYDHSQVVTGNPHNTNVDDLGDVDASAPAVDDVLVWNGSAYVNRPGEQVTIGVNTAFFLDDDVSTGGQQTLLKTPDTATATETDSVVVNNNTLEIEHYLYDTALGGTEIEGGIWEFNFWAFVSSTINNSFLIYVPYKVVAKTGTVTITGTGTSRTATVTGATPFVAGDANASIIDASCLQTPNETLHITAFTSDSVVTVETPNAYVNESGVAYSIQYKLFDVSSQEIDNTTVGLNTVVSIQDTFAITATDKFALGVYATTDATSNRTVSYTHNGTDNYSHFHAPLGIRHNDLAGLNVGDFVHLTAAEKSKLDGIEAGADVTDATNVDAAGATMNTDTSLAGNGYFIDEDTMVSNLDTKVPSQQSVKAYADSKVATTITDGVTTSAPNQNAVFDALALKAPLASPTFTGTTTVPLLKLTGGELNPVNLLTNGDFNLWSAGDSVAPDGWTQSGGTIAKESSVIKLAPYSLKYTRATGVPYIYQQIHETKGIAYWQGRTVTLSGWVKTNVASGAYLYIRDAIGTSNVLHNGNDAWQYLSVTRTIDASATIVEVRISMEATGDVYFDGLMLTEGSSIFSFAEKPLDYQVGTFTPTVTLVGGSGNTVPVYSTNIGRYVKIGKICWVEIRLDGDGGDEGAGTGQIYIQLPFTRFASGASNRIVSGFLENGTASYIPLVVVETATNTIAIRYYNTIASQTSFTGAHQNNTIRSMMFTFTYEVA